MDCIVHRITKSQTQLSNFHFHAHEVYDQRVILSSLNTKYVLYTKQNTKYVSVQ